MGDKMKGRGKCIFELSMATRTMMTPPHYLSPISGETSWYLNI